MNMEGEIFACQPSMSSGIEVKTLITQVCTNEEVGEKFRNGTYKNKAKENITTKNADLFSLNSALPWMGQGERKRRCQHKNGHVDPVDPGKNNRKPLTSIHTAKVLNQSLEKRQYLQQSAGKTDFHMQKSEINPYLSSSIDINCKWVSIHSVRPQNLRRLEKNQ